MQHKRAQGFTLIEVLIAFFVLAFGLLAIATMQLNMVRATFNARMANQATMLADDLAERMRASPKDAQKNFKDCPGDVPQGAGDWCDAVKRVFYQGQANVQPGKPNGLDKQGCVAIAGMDKSDPGDYTIEIRWSSLPWMLREQESGNRPPSRQSKQRCFVYVLNVGPGLDAKQ